MQKSDLANRLGRIVSQRDCASGKKSYEHIKLWVSCVRSARRVVGPDSGRFVNGTPLNNKTRGIYIDVRAFSRPWTS